MKNLMLLCFLFSLFGCKQNTHKKTIYGSWTTIKERKYTADEIIDSIVFTKPNSLNSYYVMNGKIEDSLNATFRFHEDELITQFGDSVFKFEIIELNNQNLITRQINKKNSITYYRLK